MDCYSAYVRVHMSLDGTADSGSANCLDRPQSLSDVRVVKSARAGARNSAEEFAAPPEQQRCRQRDIFPGRVVTLTPPMQHHVERGDRAEAIAGERAEPFQVVVPDRPRDRFAVQLRDFLWTRAVRRHRPVIDPGLAI